MGKKFPFLLFALVGVCGFIIGNGAYGLYSANALSYLSNDSAACNNCHVMNEVSHDWAKSSHQNVSCIDCHLPHSFVRKWVSKAQAGLSHAYHFTFDKNLPPHFTANDDTRAWVQENCIRCHGDYAHNAINPLKPLTSSSPNASRASAKEPSSLTCTSCHHSVGHLRDF